MVSRNIVLSNTIQRWGGHHVERAQEALAARGQDEHGLQLAHGEAPAEAQVRPEALQEVQDDRHLPGPLQHPALLRFLLLAHAP